MKPSLRPSGFTLIEILMAVSIIAIVAAVSLPQFIDFRSDAKAAVTRERLQSLRKAISGDSQSNRTGYLSHMGAPPTSLNDLVTKGTQPSYDPIGKLGWNGPYVDGTVSDWNLDSWGTAYSYNSTSRTITSCGPDRSCGNTDDISVAF